MTNTFAPTSDRLVYYRPGCGIFLLCKVILLFFARQILMRAIPSTEGRGLTGRQWFFITTQTDRIGACWLQRCRGHHYLRQTCQHAAINIQKALYQWSLRATTKWER